MLFVDDFTANDLSRSTNSLQFIIHGTPSRSSPVVPFISSLSQLHRYWDKYPAASILCHSSSIPQLVGMHPAAPTLRSSSSAAHRRQVNPSYQLHSVHRHCTATTLELFHCINIMQLIAHRMANASSMIPGDVPRMAPDDHTPHQYFAFIFPPMISPMR